MVVSKLDTKAFCVALIVGSFFQIDDIYGRQIWNGSVGLCVGGRMPNGSGRGFFLHMERWCGRCYSSITRCPEHAFDVSETAVCLKVRSEYLETNFSFVCFFLCGNMCWVP